MSLELRVLQGLQGSHGWKDKNLSRTFYLPACTSAMGPLPADTSSLQMDASDINALCGHVWLLEDECRSWSSL
jgi:hypothetical protein